MRGKRKTAVQRIQVSVIKLIILKLILTINVLQALLEKTDELLKRIS